MQGNINNTGYIEGQINESSNMEGSMSTESLIGGQVVGMRGLKGEQGERGYTGNGISSAVLNDDYTLTLTFTDGTTYTTPSIRGAKGEDGIVGRDGTSIYTIEKTSTSGLVDTYTITLTDGTTHTFEVTNGQDGYTPQKGVDYFDGEDGVSPSASVTKVGKVATITITDEEGTTSASVSDGQDGINGVNGADGADGFSPTATVTKSGKTATISITDVNGTTTATVSDGEDGASDWSDITNKPSTFPPSSHNHDDRYYTEGEVDTALSNKVGLTDYATGSDAGVVKTTSTYGVQTTASGYLYGLNIPSAQYGATSSNAVVSKGTLDNLISSGHIAQESDIPTKTSELTNDSNFVKNTDYATSSVGGVIMTGTTYGTEVSSSGYLRASIRTQAQYSSGGDNLVVGKGTLENIGDDFVSRHQNLSAYRTSADQDVIDGGKANEIVVENHVLSTNYTVASGSYNNSNYTVTKSGYRPIGIVGHQCTNGSGSGGTFATWSTLHFTSVGSGTGTLQVIIRAVGGKVDGATINVDVLWQKE